MHIVMQLLLAYLAFAVKKKKIKIPKAQHINAYSRAKSFTQLLVLKNFFKFLIVSKNFSDQF